MLTPLVDFRDEEGVEIYYSFAVTRWLHVSPGSAVHRPRQRRKKRRLRCRTAGEYPVLTAWMTHWRYAWRYLSVNICRSSRLFLVTAALSLPAVVTAQDAPAPGADERVSVSPNRDVYFGNLHAHTGWSFDAFSGIHQRPTVDGRSIG